jgi:hypothetical protein
MRSCLAVFLVALVWAQPPSAQLSLVGDWSSGMVGKVFHHFGMGRTMLSFDVYNLLNANPVLTENSAFGRWRQPTNVLQGRLGKISLQFDF